MGAQCPQIGQTQLGLGTPLRADQLVPLVQNDRLQVTKPLGPVWVGQHHRQGLGGGDQNIRHLLELLGAARGAGIPRARLDGNAPAHGGDGSGDRLLNIP